MIKEELKKIIADFEKGRININSALESIYNITSIRLNESRLRNYWRSESVDELIASITYEEYSEWKNLDDKEAMKLLDEIKEYIGNQEILLRNSEALEKRYKKPTGTISDFIFQNDYTNKEILRKLK